MHPKVIVNGFSGLLVFLLVFNCSQSFIFEDDGGTESCNRDVGFFRNEKVDDSCNADKKNGKSDMARIHFEKPRNNWRSSKNQKKEYKSTNEMKRATSLDEHQRKKSDIRNENIVRGFFRSENRKIAEIARRTPANYGNARLERQFIDFRSERLNSVSRHRSRFPEEVRRNLRLTVRENRLISVESASHHRVPTDRRDRRTENQKTRVENIYGESSTRSSEGKNLEEPNMRSRGYSAERSRLFESSRRSLRQSFSLSPITLHDEGSRQRLSFNARNERIYRLSSQPLDSSRRDNRRLALPQNQPTPSQNTRTERTQVGTNRKENGQTFNERRREETMASRDARRNLMEVRSSESPRRSARNERFYTESSSTVSAAENRRNNGRESDTLRRVIRDNKSVRREVGIERSSLHRANTNDVSFRRINSLTVGSNRHDEASQRSSSTEQAQRRLVKDEEGFQGTRGSRRYERSRRNVSRLREFGNDRRQRQNIGVRKIDTFDQKRNWVDGRVSRVVSPVEQRQIDSISPRLNSEEMVRIGKTETGFERNARLLTFPKRIRDVGDTRRQVSEHLDENRSRIVRRTAQRTLIATDRRHPVIISTRRNLEESRWSTIQMHQIRRVEERTEDVRRSFKRVDSQQDRITSKTRNYIRTERIEKSSRISADEGLRRTNTLSRKHLLGMVRKLPSDSEYLSKHKYGQVDTLLEDSNVYWRGVQLALASILVVQWLFVKDENLKAGCFLRNSMKKVHVF